MYIQDQRPGTREVNVKSTGFQGEPVAVAGCRGSVAVPRTRRSPQRTRPPGDFGGFLIFRGIKRNWRVSRGVAVCRGGGRGGRDGFPGGGVFCACACNPPSHALGYNVARGASSGHGGLGSYVGCAHFAGPKRRRSKAARSKTAPVQSGAGPKRRRSKAAPFQNLRFL
jgi:hypothetical protein